MPSDAVAALAARMRQAEERTARVNEIRRSLELIHSPGDTFEIRALTVGKVQTVSGFFNNFEKAATAVEWIFIDLDPERPSGICATDSEKKTATDLAIEVEDLLTQRGWPCPLIQDSGNGCYLLYRVDLQNDESTKKMLMTFYDGLKALLRKPDTSKEYSKLDVSVFNAARIARIGGTTNRKGDSTNERPHRVSVLHSPTDEQPVLVVPVELIQEIAAIAPQKNTGAKTTTNNPPSHHKAMRLKVADYLGDHNMAFRTKDVDGGVAYLVACPFNGTHGGSSESALYQSEAGKLTYECKHNSCQGKGWADFRDVVGKPKKQHYEQADGTPNVPGLPEVLLPDGMTTISSTAKVLGGLMSASGKFYFRGGSAVRKTFDDAGEVKLELLRPASACSDFEQVARLVKIKIVEGEPENFPVICSESMARAIISAQTFSEQLPSIKVLSRCPAIIERDGGLEVITGYDRTSGILAMGESPPVVPLDKAKALLTTLVSDIAFATKGDRSRALAAFITPALVLGGLLGGRSPIDVGEADESQSGKGYRNKITTAIYRHSSRTITQRERGVGSLQEGFDACLVAGASFVTFDNVRGNLNAPWFESFMTERSYSARVPYSTPVEIDATRTVVLLTTNKAELTRDLANRCSVVRIRKHGDEYKYKIFPEGDLLAHVEANQPKFLGAVFSIIREWHRQGKPTVENAAHDFRRWASVLGWIVERILGASPLMEGHRDVQARMTTPALTWLRDVALAVRELATQGEWLRANKLLDIVLTKGIHTPGIDPDGDLEDAVEFGKANRAIGRQLSKAFSKDEKTEIVIDDVTVKRRSTIDENKRDRKEYAFFFGFPHGPAYDPACATLFPAFPALVPTLISQSGDTYSSSDYTLSAPMGGMRGACGETPEREVDAV